MARNKVNFPNEFSHISNIKLDENSGDLLVALHEYKTQELHELKDELARAQIDDIGDWLYSFYGKFAGIDLTGNKTVKDYIDANIEANSSASAISGLHQSMLNAMSDINYINLQIAEIQNNLLVINDNDVPDSTNTNANDGTEPNI